MRLTIFYEKGVKAENPILNSTHLIIKKFKNEKNNNIYFVFSIML